MLGYVRIVVVLFLLLTVIYISLTFISRMKQKDRLRSEYAQAEPNISKQEYVEKGIAQYNRTLRPKLILGVYLLPLAVVTLLLFLAHT